MRVLRLYAPAIVLALMAVMRAVGVSLTSLSLLVLAGAVWVHVRAEAWERKR